MKKIFSILAVMLFIFSTQAVAGSNEACDILKETYSSCNKLSKDYGLFGDAKKCNVLSVETTMTLFKKLYNGKLDDNVIKVSELIGIVCFAGCMNDRETYRELENNCR